MGLRNTLILSLLIAGGVGLYYFLGKTSSQSPNKNPVYTDSIAAPSRPSITAQKDTLPQPVGEKFAPGTAQIKATILSVEKIDQSVEIEVTVDKVMGYGPSTPPIATGTNLLFDIAGFLEDRPAYGSRIKEGAKINVLIAFQQELRGNKPEGGQRWAFIEFKE